MGRPDHDGSIAPALMLFMFALVAGALFFLRQAEAASLAADADSAADAAALAGADAGRTDTPSVATIVALLRPGGVPPGLRRQAIAEASDYAARNDATLVSADLTRVPGETALRFTATVRGEANGDGESARRTSTAELRYTLIPAGDGAACVPQSVVDGLLDDAGVTGRHNGVSGLVQCAGTNTVGLDPEFTLAFLRAEAALKQQQGADAIITLSSAYRSTLRQAELFAAYQACLATGSDECTPAAAPGTSLHEIGRAIDVPEAFSPTLQAALAADRNTGMVYPAIGNDPYHFQDRRGRGGIPNGNAFGLLEFDDTILVATP